nr:MAG TPA: hypothetical protein [Crassvirales sp.]
MKTKRNDIKEFAIGTKIEYNGKLYEVVNCASCDDCSLKAICSNSDVDKSDSDVGILRSERIRIFGECSSVARSDGKSVVFAEIVTAKEPDVYDTVCLYKIDNEHNYIKIDIPDDSVIDIENSDLIRGTICFKKKWLTLEQVCKSLKENYYLTYHSSIKDFRDGKLVALANLMDIARYFNGDWNYKSNGNDCGYIIAYDKTTTEPYYYQIVSINADTDMYFGNIVFKNEADAQHIIDNPNFRSILDKIFKV